MGNSICEAEENLVNRGVHTSLDWRRRKGKSVVPFPPERQIESRGELQFSTAKTKLSRLSQIVSCSVQPENSIDGLKTIQINNEAISRAKQLYLEIHIKSTKRHIRVTRMKSEPNGSNAIDGRITNDDKRRENQIAQSSRILC
jgi:hypothetical protein